jgi:phosphoribosylamine-glycine ligase
MRWSKVSETSLTKQITGTQVVVEEFLDGEEASYFAFCDGETAGIFFNLYFSTGL